MNMNVQTRVGIPMLIHGRAAGLGLGSAGFLDANCANTCAAHTVRWSRIGEITSVVGATRQTRLARCGAGPCYSRVPVLSPLRLRQSAGDLCSEFALREV
eukprot:1192715-Prorocentrum_minimum.AAC.3